MLSLRIRLSEEQAMALSSTHQRFGHGLHRSPEVSAHTHRETIEHGTYTALLATAGFIIINLLKVTERRDERPEHPHH